MKSKAHFKKCTELGLNPIPTAVPDEDGCDFDDSASRSGRKRNSDENAQRDGSLVESNYDGDSDTDDCEESDDMDTDSDGKLFINNKSGIY